jgi:outer membrane protein assembly factor BamD
LVVLAATACWGRGGAPAEVTAETLLERARAAIRRGDFMDARRDLERLTFALQPGDAEQAEVRYFLAETFFQTDEYAEAAQRFRQVADQYPASDYAPVALLRAGDANLRLWRKPDLDATSGRAALALYQELAGRYPGSAASTRAQPHIRHLQDWFAEKSYKTGVFYLRRGAYDSAILYFKDIVATYPAARRVPDALLRLVDAYRTLGYDEERRETCAHLERFFPQASGLAERCPASRTAGTEPS